MNHGPAPSRRAADGRHRRSTAALAVVLVLMKEPGDLFLQHHNLTRFDVGEGMFEELALNLGRQFVPPQEHRRPEILKCVSCSDKEPLPLCTEPRAPPSLSHLERAVALGLLALRLFRFLAAMYESAGCGDEKWHPPGTAAPLSSSLSLTGCAIGDMQMLHPPLWTATYPAVTSPLCAPKAARTSSFSRFGTLTKSRVRPSSAATSSNSDGEIRRSL
jgi:hypothetical protein